MEVVQAGDAVSMAGRGAMRAATESGRGQQVRPALRRERAHGGRGQ
ncbi:hypothetical protein [Streptomyces sp. 2A115]